ncbi:S9 family peptidase [Dyadobacter tibetensis]|uniref:S9 family peptidase n=1 Tax=Dyadobacter tibetensis TaxID=1211851 RepID=UPI000471FED4|nr:S9 family peptidase [Dyadobacter tibetensis]
MKQRTLITLILFQFLLVDLRAQKRLTAEKLWSLGRVSPLGISKDQQYVLYAVSTPDIKENKSTRKLFKVPLAGGEAEEVSDTAPYLVNDRLSPNGHFIFDSRPVQERKMIGADLYPDLPKSDAYVYEALNYRHWDTWEDGKYDHVMVAPYTNGVAGEYIDIMKGEPFDCPQKPFGGNEDFIWSPDSKRIIYVTKKKYGTEYTISTNTDLYEYDLATKLTKNLTESNKGYDIAPAFNQKGDLAWLQMKRDGYEADKQDLVVMDKGGARNLTASRDELHVQEFAWSEEGTMIYFTAPINGTVQLFQVSTQANAANIKQLTQGDFDINGIVGQVGERLIVSRSDMNHASELYKLSLTTGSLEQLTHVNDTFYNSIDLVKTERQWVTTTDGQKMLVWVIFPPDFDPNKKYPTLLYCQGGPQSALTQFYSFRWNFQLMASQGYIVVAPNRRGMPGHGTKWNEAVSKDWGGQVIRDYLSAIDTVAKAPYVDKNRMGCVGASFGGFSVFALQAIHGDRFKTFISHDGVFDFRSMYGTTDEMFFENWEKGGPYWDKKNAVAQRSFSQSPSNFVDQWKTPIFIIQGGRDYRVPIEQGLQAFQAAQLQGIKSKLLYLPEENHWVLSAQNAMVWQREFFGWLKETL